MKVCFLMYPWAAVEPETDSTLRLVHEAASRGHMVAITVTSSLTIRGNVVSAFCDVLQRNIPVSPSVPTFYKKAEFKRTQLPLAGFDAIIMRSNPPLDSLALNFLDSIRSDVFIANDIDGLRLANNKLYTTSLFDADHDFIPTTHVSKNREYLERVFHESPKDKMILKPLNGYGGQGVIVLQKSAEHNFRSLLDYYIGRGGSREGNYVILQDYVDGAEEGDIRVLMLNGEPIGAMRRIPAPGDIRSNVHAGGTVVRHVLTPAQKQLCKFVGPKLARDGLYFTGIDIVGDKLLEVNVMSPGGITRINKLNRVRLQKDVIDFVESQVNVHTKRASRKSEYRKALEDADLK
ncbi:MAG: glutathione synthetase [Chlamydiia bacterium]|nr:glutathione synthetase [Chlamydiia bacterium]